MTLAGQNPQSEENNGVDVTTIKGAEEPTGEEGFGVRYGSSKYGRSRRVDKKVGIK
jgi:hypothetical protein